MNQKLKTILTVICFSAILGLSLLKDNFTPDYLNTYNAYFLNPAHPEYTQAIKSHITHSYFWVAAYAYSIVFCLLPCGIIHLLFGKKYSVPVLYLLVSLFIAEYAIVLAELNWAKAVILPKINRYYHSPLLTFMMVGIIGVVRKYETD